ncbi:hypothetical protein [Serratia fonticola]|uniref:hypothetical protein n=1 Tax=Serratia fonticola TaxID=47917 RepID=UPI003BB6189B
MTLERYLQVTGMNESTALKYIKEGIIITRPTPKDWKKSLIEVNMLAMFMKAAGGVDVQIVK